MKKVTFQIRRKKGWTFQKQKICDEQMVYLKKIKLEPYHESQTKDKIFLKNQNKYRTFFKI